MSWLRVDRGLAPSAGFNGQIVSVKLDPPVDATVDPYLKPEFRSGKPFLPSPTLEFLHSSREVSEAISQGNDLDLKFVDGVRCRVSLDLRDGHETTGGSADQGPDVTLGFFGAGDVNHEVSFQLSPAPEVGLMYRCKLTVRDGVVDVEVSFPSRVGTEGEGAAGIPPSVAPDSP